MNSQTKTLPVEAVLLDVDGTLLDSNHAHAQSWVQVLKQHGHIVPYDRIRALMGKGGDKLLPDVASVAIDSPEYAEITQMRNDLFLRRFLPRLRPTKGARRMLQKMKTEGLRLVVATSAGDELPKLLRQANVEDLVELKTTSKDVKHSKPDNDIVVAALDKAGVAPEQALMFGDTPYDVQAANAAGVACVALRCGGWWEDPAFSEAIAVFDDPASFVRAWPKHFFEPNRLSHRNT